MSRPGDPAMCQTCRTRNCQSHPSRPPKTNPADIGRTSAPTPEQVRRYAQLRTRGATAVEAARKRR